tara:strand:- start:1148 stop:1342 length:195 start_codon:yes stop_codon:yes gene_type:complete
MVLSLSLSFALGYNDKNLLLFLPPKTEEKKLENLVKTPLRKETKKTLLLTEAKQKRKEEEKQTF